MFSLQTESVGTRRTIHQGYQSRRNETNRKDVPPTTLAFFLGFGFDTVTMEFWVPLDKAQIFATSTVCMLREEFIRVPRLIIQCRCSVSKCHGAQGRIRVTGGH